MLLFPFAGGTAWLFFARILSGVAVGLASGTGTAWLVDLEADRTRATLAAALANAIGFALGPLVGGLLAQYAFAPLRSPFVAYIPVLVVVGVLAAVTRETVTSAHPKLDLELLRPRVGVPKSILARFIAPAVTCFATFALVGFYAVVGGAIVFELALAAAVVMYAGRNVKGGTAMLGALATLLPCVAILLAAQPLHSLPMLLVATALGGVCWGLGIRGSLRIVNDIAPSDRRGEVASAYYIAAFALAAIVVGIRYPARP
jgi:MFS family permease